MKGYFITGTDTDVGKTFVACALLIKAAEKGFSTSAVKPVAAGAELIAGQLRNGDGLALQSAITLTLPYEKINPVCLAPAIAPHIAAGQAGVLLNTSLLVEQCQRVFEYKTDYCMVEGAGGWRVPLNKNETFANLAQALALPVILVVGMKLGCINHALLTAEAIKRDGLVLAGWVANSTAGKMSQYRENMATLKELIKAPLLGEVPFIDSGDYQQAANTLELPAV